MFQVAVVVFQVRAGSESAVSGLVALMRSSWAEKAVIQRVNWRVTEFVESSVACKTRLVQTSELSRVVTDEVEVALMRRYDLPSSSNPGGSMTE